MTDYLANTAANIGHAYVQAGQTLEKSAQIVEHVAASIVGDVGAGGAEVYAGITSGNGDEVMNGLNKIGANVVSLVATDGAGDATAVEARAASTIERNAASGAAFEDSVVAATKATDLNVAEQVTLKTETGVKTRMDVVSTRTSGEIRLQEAKSSATAPLTKNQRLAHPEIAKTGATVAGKGKSGYPGGTKIPPTKVDVVRPR